MLITGFAAVSSDANCYLVAARPGADAFVIDPGDGAASTVEYYCETNALTLAAVLLTDGCPEHTASVPELCDGWEVPAYIHPAARPLLAAELGDEPEQVVEITDGQQLRVADILVTVDHIPGHSAGSVVFRVSADTDEGAVGVVFTGDTLLRRSIGATDTAGGDRATLLGSIAEKLLVLDDEAVVLPGHGSATSIGDERRFNPDLTALRGI